MGDIDFEEQLELERLEAEKKARLAEEGKTERVDPDGTVFEWDEQKQAWFPKIDADFIAQYQMKYGESSDGSQDDASKQQTDYEKYVNYYQNYIQAELQEEQVLQKKPKQNQGEETHEATLQKLEHLENKMQSGQDDETEDGQYSSDTKEDMEKYTEEQKKQYNEYWSYYYGTEYHDYYSDCLAQDAAAEAKTDPNDKGSEEKEGKEEENKEGKKKAKKRKGPPPRDQGWFDVDSEHNRNVYVSGLPLDVTMDEFREMMHKYGLIEFDPRSKQPKIKLYMDENGQPKGDGRCCFIKKESVDLILNLLDGADYKGHKIHVERAQFHMKGDYDPSKKKKKLTNKEKRKLKERQAKLFDWRPDKMRGERAKHERVVILKNLFDPKTFEDDPAQITTLTNNIRTECGNYGDVKKVVVYDRHQDGVVKVMFSSAEEADMCIQYMNQRYFGQRRLLAAAWDGKAKYEVEETEAEREARLKKWENFLEEEEKDISGTPSGSRTTNNGTSLPASSPKETSNTDSNQADNTSQSDGKTDSNPVSNVADPGTADNTKNTTAVDSGSKEGLETETTVAKPGEG